jgi:hypothetical protein
VETDLQQGQTVYVIGEVEDDFPVTVVRRVGSCRHCGLSLYRCRTPAAQQLLLCRSAVIFPN